MSVRQTRIFVPPAPPYDGPAWVETIVGFVIAPLVTENDQVDWFWFSRYVARVSDSEDCNINAVPQEFGAELFDQIWQSVGRQGLFRSLKLRYSVCDQALSAFEEHARELIRAQGCVISDFRDYDSVGDLGADRFLGGDRSAQRRSERAELIERHLCSLCQLFIHCLVGPDETGRFRLEEERDSRQNPHGSIFESVHHLFCNITGVPLWVLVSQDGIGTDWSMPVGSQGSSVAAFRVWF